MRFRLAGTAYELLTPILHGHLTLCLLAVDCRQRYCAQKAWDKWVAYSGRSLQDELFASGALLKARPALSTSMLAR
jgi:hypothetical protein